MTRETLKMHLGNEPMMSIVKQIIDFDEIVRQLRNARNVMNATDIEKSAVSLVENKLSEYQALSKNLTFAIEDTWHLHEREARIIKRHAHCTNVDALPVNIED